MSIRKTLASLLFAGTTMLGTIDKAQAGPVYSEDFSTDPHWITDQPSYYYWDADSETFNATTENAQGGHRPTRYAYTPINYNGDSMRLEFDMKPISLQWSAAVSFGLYNQDLSLWPWQESPNANSLFVSLGRVDGGRHLTLSANGTNGNTSENLWNIINEGNWYHFVMEYNQPTHDLSLMVSDKNNGNPIGNIVFENVILADDLDYLGFARDPSGFSCPGANGHSCSNKATATLDNITFSVVPEPSSLELLAAGGLVILLHRRKSK